MKCFRCHDKNFLIECACRCGRIIFERYRTSNHKRKYIKGHQSRRELHYDYKGRIVNRYGYVSLFRPDHHFADKNGYVREHRIVWEKHHKACLLRWASVHHQNSIKDDNRIQNLHAMMSRHHKILHSHDHFAPFKDMSERKCLRCGTNKTTKYEGKYDVWYRHPVTKQGFYCSRCGKIIRSRLRKVSDLNIP